MVITIFVFTLFGTPALVWRIVSRVIAIPIIAAISYEALRFGAKHPGSLLMRGLMTPGIWLQRITTQQPDRSQIEIAVTSFRELLRREAEATGARDGASRNPALGTWPASPEGRCIGRFLREDDAVPHDSGGFPMPTSDLDMPLLPSAEQIRRREFATVRRGYDPQQVRAYLTSIANQVGTLERELSQLRLEVGSSAAARSEQTAEPVEVARAGRPPATRMTRCPSASPP